MIKSIGYGRHGDQGYTNIEFDTSAEYSALMEAIEEINKINKPVCERDGTADMLV